MTAPPSDEDLLLALVNSTPVRDGEPTDQLADDREAAAWARAHGGTGSAAETGHLRRLRDALQAVLRDDAEADTLAPFLERVRTRPSLDGVALTWHLEVPDDRRLAARAVLAWARLEAASPGRLKPCANHECRLFLLDRTRAGTARWCSMATCGNRMKARRHHRRRQPSS